MSLKRITVNADEVVVIGKAPKCPDCNVYMCPVNDPQQPDWCRCPQCLVKEARFTWFN